MTELDPRIAAAIERSRASRSPPAGHEQRMLAQFRARLDGPVEAAGDALDHGAHASGVGSGAGSGAAGGTQVVHALKIVGAVIGLWAAGLAGVAAVAKAVRDDDGASTAVIVESRVADHPVVQPSGEPEPIAEIEAPSPAEPEPEPDQLEAAPNRAAAPARPATRSNSPATLGAELQLIRAARSAAPLDALELLDRHAEQFADGELSSEREGLRVIALCKLGRGEQAQQASERLLARDPGALLLQKVADACRQQISLPTTNSPAAGNR